MKTTRSISGSFTLVEMIVAMGVLSVLTFLLFSVLNETTRAISLSSGRTKVYTELRVVIDQLSRDLQQAVDDDRYNCFVGTTNILHFVATIDNDTGDEEAEVGYYFYPADYTLRKTLQFSRKNGLPNADWDLGVARTNAASAAAWTNSPALPTNPTNDVDYAVVLEGVRSLRFIYRDTNGNTNSSVNWIFQTNQNNQLPAYIRTEITICDPQDVIRYRGAGNVPSSLFRYFTNDVYLPRQQ